MQQQVKQLCDQRNRYYVNKDENQTVEIEPSGTKLERTKTPSYVCTPQFHSMVSLCKLIPFVIIFVEDFYGHWFYDKTNGLSTV